MSDMGVSVMYECFHCLKRAVIWDCDYDMRDVYPERGEGVVHMCHCTNCGAEIEYIVPFNKDEEE